MGRQETLLKIEKVPFYSAKDRRSHADRRKSGRPAYFINGGKERRSWRERRFLWYMTR